MLRSVLSIPKRIPFAFAVGYGGAKTVGADIMVQKLVEGRAELDQKRAAVFLGFGLFQVGFVQYLLYVSAFSRAFPGAAAFSAKTFSEKLKDVPGMKNVVKQVALDQFVYHPFCYFPVFYSCKEIVLGEAKGPRETFTNAIQKYIPNMFDDLKALWKLYIPVSIIQFSIMPMHLRVPFVATVGIFWCAILSSMRGAPQLSDTAKDVKRGMENLAQEDLQQKLNGLFSQYAKEGGVDQKIFKQIMAEIGIAASKGGVLSDETLTSLFDSFDNDGNGTIDAGEFLTGLQVLAGKGTPQERIRFVFEALDVNHDQYVTLAECKQVVYQLLMTREVLLRFPVNTDANVHMHIGAAREDNIMNDSEKKSTAEVKLLRLQQIWAQHPDYYGQSLEDCILLQASAISSRLMDDAGGTDGRLPIDRFEEWIQKRSAHSERLMALFNVLASVNA